MTPPVYSACNCSVVLCILTMDGSQVGGGAVSAIQAADSLSVRGLSRFSTIFRSIIDNSFLYLAAYPFVSTLWLHGGEK